MQHNNKTNSISSKDDTGTISHFSVTAPLNQIFFQFST